MREYMPTTHADPETIKAYAAGEASFDDIAEDRGVSERTTMDTMSDTELQLIIRKREKENRNA